MTDKSYNLIDKNQNLTDIIKKILLSKKGNMFYITDKQAGDFAREIAQAVKSCCNDCDC